MVTFSLYWWSSIFICPKHVNFHQLWLSCELKHYDPHLVQICHLQSTLLSCFSEEQNTCIYIWIRLSTEPVIWFQVIFIRITYYTVFTTIVGDVALAHLLQDCPLVFHYSSIEFKEERRVILHYSSIVLNCTFFSFSGFFHLGFSLIVFKSRDGIWADSQMSPPTAKCEFFFLWISER